MTTTPTDEPGTPPIDESATTSTDDFDHDLEALLLAAFATGVTIQGEWTVVSPSTSVPSWRVTIEKITDGDAPAEDAVFLDD